MQLIMASFLVLIGVLVGAAAAVSYLHLRGRLASPVPVQWSPSRPGLFAGRSVDEPKKRLFGEPPPGPTEPASGSRHGPMLTLAEHRPTDVTIRARMAGSMAEPFRTLHLIAFGLVDGERTVVAGSADGGPDEPIPVSRIEAAIDVIERKRVVDLWTWLGTAQPVAMRASTAPSQRI
jgi:hypothetical protein